MKGGSCYTYAQYGRAPCACVLEVMEVLKKWPLMIAFAAIGFAGCGGSGGDGDGGGNVGGGGGNGGGETGIQVNLPAAPGLVNFIYLTGQGRADDVLTSVISQIELTDTFGTEGTQLEDPLFLPLNQFSSQLRGLNIATTNSRDFPVFRLNITRLERNQVPVSSATPLVNEGFAANIHALPGRQTTVPVFLNDGMFKFKSSDGSPVFDREQFKAVNNSNAGRIEAFLGDYVRFNIQSMSFIGEKPKVTAAANKPAGYVYVSGDRVAVSVPGTSGRFEVLTDDPQNDREAGFFGPNVTLPGGEGGAALGSYAVEATDPNDLTRVSKITSVQGIYRDFDEVLTGLSNFGAISFPNVNDDEKNQQFVLAAMETFTSGGKTRYRVKGMYIGLANFVSNRFKAYPLSSFAVPGSVAGEISGTLGSYIKRSNRGKTVVLRGTYSVTAGAVPAGIEKSGPFTVFRR